jgi:hypothetical protein
MTSLNRVVYEKTYFETMQWNKTKRRKGGFNESRMEVRVLF